MNNQWNFLLYFFCYARNRCFANSFYSTHINANVLSTIVGLGRSPVYRVIFIPTEDLGDQFLLNLCLLKILETIIDGFMLYAHQ